MCMSVSLKVCSCIMWNVSAPDSQSQPHVRATSVLGIKVFSSGWAASRVSTPHTLFYRWKDWDRVSLCKLAWHLLTRACWPQSPGDRPASASRVLGLRARTTMLYCFWDRVAGSTGLPRTQKIADLDLLNLLPLLPECGGYRHTLWPDLVCALLGIEPRVKSMLGERSTAWATAPPCLRHLTC